LNISVNVKQQGSKRDTFANMPFHIEHTPETLRELIRECVYRCVQTYNNTLDIHCNAEQLSDRTGDTIANVGKTIFGMNYSGKPLELNAAYQNAITRYEDGLFRVFLDLEELTELDAPIPVTENSKLIFFRKSMAVSCDTILIRDAIASDAEQLCAWWNDGNVMAHAGFPNGLGTSTEKILKQLAENTSGNSSQNHRHMIFYNNIPIGEMNYRSINEITCEIGIKICDPSYRNKGLGKIILSLFIEALFNEFGFQKILLDTNLNNKRAQHVYEQLGFKKLRINLNSWKDQLGNLQSSVDYELTPSSFISYL